jgi:Na+/proline symporter
MWFNIDLIILFLFLVANFVVGFGIRRKVSNRMDVSDFKTYSIGNFKEPSLFFLTASFTSSIITGGFFLILLQQSYKTGMSYIIKNILIDPLSYVITAFFVFSMHKNTKRGGLTLNEWMDEKYHSSFLRAVMGLAELVGRFAMLSIQFKAFGTIAKVLFNLSPQYEKICIIGFAVFLILYTFRGGFVSIVLTDILQLQHQLFCRIVSLVL